MSDAAQWLEAGGLVPVGAPVPSDLPTDTVDARVYTHGGIPGRVVVRLVPDAIARGIDTEMGLFGFAMTGHHDDIARQRRRTLGFPGSALVADPERARYALDVMKEFRKQAKRITSKPGHARDGFDAIAEKLARQVPHFLPSYWEEVGRAFAGAGNFQYAASSFDKARTAEREYGLEVDEERRGEAFLEFALLGALTVKSLQAYAKELQKSVGGESAYERMFQLAVRRTLGGLPPWASLPKDLRGLIKAAKKNQGAEDERFLKEVISSSALQRAPASFWSEYAGAAASLSKKDPAFRARLLDLFPSGGKSSWSWRNDDDDFEGTWMELLAEAGALEVLSDPKAPAEAIPSGGRAAWFKRLQDWSHGGSGWVLQLARKAAPVLKAEGAPVEIRTGDWSSPLDLDLLDLLIELEVPWKPEDPHFRVDLSKWAQWTSAEARAGFPEEKRPRDPVFAARDPQVAPLLAPAIDAAFGDEHFEGIAASMTALQHLRREWLDRQIADLTATGLAATFVALGRLEAATSPATFAEFPHATEALAAASAAPALHRTLVTGLLDELGWPEFDRVADELKFAPDTEFHVGRQFPHLILGNDRKLFVLGPNGLELTHDLKLPKDTEPSSTAYVGGQLYVAWSAWTAGSWKTTAYWSGRPGDTFEVQRTYHRGDSNPWVLPDAALFGGGRFSVGDRTEPPSGGNQFHDADQSWVWDEGELKLQDRQTGKPLGKGAPAFLADGEGGAVSGSYTWIPPQVANGSPLPLADGQYGAKVVRGPKFQARADDDVVDLEAYEDEEGGPPTTDLVFETLAGDRYVGTFRHGTANWTPTMLVRWPGGALRAVREEQQWWRNAHNPSFYVADPERPQVALMADGSARMRHGWLPPAAFWHYLRPRDEKGSIALRKLAPAVADQLLERALADESTDDGPTVAAVAELIPAVTDPTLRRGIAVVARVAAELETRLRKLREMREGGTVAARPTSDDVADQAAIEALAPLGRYYAWGGGHVTAEIRTLGGYLVKGENGTNVLMSRANPHAWLGHVRALGWLVARPGLPADQRALLLKIVRGWIDSGLADDCELRLGSMRIDKLEKWVPTKTEDGETTPHEAWRYWEDHRRILVWECSEDAEGPWEVEFAEWVADPAKFGEYPGATVTKERRISIRGDKAWLEAMVAAADGAGQRAISSDELASFAEATGLTPPEAALVLAVLPEELDKATREGLGLKAAEVKAAAAQISVTQAFRLELLSSSAPADPADLWTSVAAERLRDAWLKLAGKSVPVPIELLTLAEKEMWGGGAQLKQVANPTGWSELSTDVQWEVNVDGAVVPKGTKPAGSDDEDDEDDAPAVSGFTGETAAEVAKIVGWLAPKLPVGSPLAANVVTVYDLARERLKNPTLWLSGGSWHTYEPKAKKAAEAWFDALGGEIVEKKDEDGDLETTQRRAGPIVANRTNWAIEVVFRPNGLDPSSRELLTKFARASESELDELAAWERLQSDDFAALVRRLADTPLAAGEWEQNAAKSAPAVVAAVAKKHGLSEDAAVLYLQTLTLLDPTKKNVILWNGWTPKTYTAAAAELVGAKLVLEAKRARAGREHFLPGGWTEAKDILPYEEWKRPLYGWEGERFPFGDPLVLAPLHVLFERAWKRCVDGDAPRFQEVRR